MINWLKRFKYKVVSTQVITVTWTDSDSNKVSHATVLFLENGFGDRKLATEGSLWPSMIKDHRFWHNVALPWKNYTVLATPQKDNVIKLVVNND